MATLKERTLSSLVWRFMERIGAQAISLIVQIVMARLLAPEDFGSLAIILVFINIGNVIVQSGLPTALVQSPTIDDDDCSTVFWLSLSISLVLYIILFAAAPAIANFYDAPELIWPLRVLTAILVINVYCSVQCAIIQRALEFKKIFRASLSAMLCSATAGIVAAFCGLGLWALVIQQMTSSCVNCFALALQSSWKLRLVFKKQSAARLFGFGWKLLASGLLDTVYQSLNDLIIGKVFSKTVLGYVSQGKKYPNAIGSALDGTIQPVMLSAVSQVQSDVEQVKRLVRRALKTSTFLIMPCMTLFALIAEPLVLILLGEKWLSCVYFMQVYCFVYALLPIHTSNLQALNAMGRSDLFLKLEFIKKAYGLLIIVITAFVIGDIYIMVGAYLISSVISTFVNAYPNKRVIGYPYLEQLRDIGPGVILSIVSAAIAWPLSLISMPSIILIILQAVVMFGAYAGLAKLFKVEEFTYLVGTAKEIISKRKGAGESEE